MSRDIDRIITRLKTEIPGAFVTQFQASNSGNDDGLWFVHLPDRDGTIQLESPNGAFPFLIESVFSPERILTRNVEDVVRTVKWIVSQSATQPGA